MYTIIMVLNFYIIFLTNLTSSNEKTQNYKVVDLVESYNFHIKIIYIRRRIEELWFFRNFSLVTPVPVARQDSTVTPTGVARQAFPRRKRRRMFRILPRQRMWRDYVIWSRQRGWRDQKGYTVQIIF